jgi:hypothetical protein
LISRSNLKSTFSKRLGLLSNTFQNLALSCNYAV